MENFKEIWILFELIQRFLQFFTNMVVIDPCQEELPCELGQEEENKEKTMLNISAL